MGLRLRRQMLLRDILETSTGLPATTTGAFLLGCERTEESISVVIQKRMKEIEETVFKTHDATLMKSFILMELQTLKREIRDGFATE